MTAKVTPSTPGQGSQGVLSLAISEIGERCEAEGIKEDDHDSEHGAGQLNSMHLPVG